MNPAGLKTYKLPPRFYYDHRSRDLPEQGITSIVSESKRAVYVEMDADAYADLLSDARHYSAGWQFGADYRGLCASARATVKALTNG